MVPQDPVWLCFRNLDIEFPEQADRAGAGRQPRGDALGADAEREVAVPSLQRPSLPSCGEAPAPPVTTDSPGAGMEIAAAW